MIRHIVLVRFAGDLDPERIAAVMNGIADLRRSIPGILAFSWGRNVSPEGLARGYTHAFTVDFEDEARATATSPIRTMRAPAPLSSPRPTEGWRG